LRDSKDIEDGVINQTIFLDLKISQKDFHGFQTNYAGIRIQIEKYSSIFILIYLIPVPLAVVVVIARVQELVAQRFIFL
jgi:hypothetical protein